jgi:hypothetical protein
MPLQLPNLDDRRYNDLLAEALERIPAYTPEWTNYNPSDPGITLVELFAYLADILLYRLNRVTDDNTRKFLKLLTGMDPVGTDLRKEIRQAVRGIRERYRAVTKDDYEFLSTDSFNQWLITNKQSSINLVARAHCVQQRNLDAGTEQDRLKLRPEHVSVVIVPAPQTPNSNPPPEVVAAASGGSSPQPSSPQIDALFSFLDERRMVTTRLHVTGPFYVHVSMQLMIARNSDAVETDLATAVHAALTGFLNPLPSSSGDGWPFGRDVFVSEVYQVLEKVPGVDYITDVMLDSVVISGDTKCVVAPATWHEEGGLVGLSIQQHHLPVFDHADIVIAPGSVFITVNLAVSAKAHANSDPALLKSSIRSTVRDIFHPLSGGPGPTTSQATDIPVADIQVAIRNLAGIMDPVSVIVGCIPPDALQKDSNQHLFIHIEAGQVVDWRVTIQLS